MSPDGLMHNLHGGIGGVDPLPARTRSAADGDVQILRFNFDIDFLGFGQHGHGGGAGMDPALGFGGGNPLHPVHAAFIFQALENVGAVDAENDFLVSAQIRGTGVQRFHFPTAAFGIAACTCGRDQRRTGRIPCRRRPPGFP